MALWYDAQMIDETKDVGQGEGGEKYCQSHHLLSHLLAKVCAKVVDQDDIWSYEASG